MPLLSIKVPAYVKENISSNLHSQVEQKGGYAEQNLHLSIACIDYNPENKPLVHELISKIEAVLQNAIPERITLQPPALFNKLYFGYPLRQASNAILEAIYIDLQSIIAELRQKYGDNEIRMIDWRPYQAHLTVFGQVTEPLELTPSDKIVAEPFIPGGVVLRDNETILHQFKAGNNETLKQTADGIMQTARADFSAFKANQGNINFLSLRKQFNFAEYYYKNLDQPNERIECLISGGQLNELYWQRTFNNKGFHSQDPERFNYRIRRVSFALEIIRTLAALDVNGLMMAPITAPTLKEAQSYLEITRKFLNSVKKDSNYQQELKKNDMDNAQGLIEAALFKLTGEDPSASKCLIM
ncbi:hypothetical protein Lqui_2454 [Legionella quinlivanii]|uniref:Uncharacterized protein n=1 Tax=Legionella quinlivanii TaxID=45073 RepID=A0A0W0XP34_9GAMM|nr:hypothetical protein [Legionella quinlivanii]KTD46529.1 hypothetical protein Lqui_2454 [Legionella quinlivanii]SEG10147.1 hypothetical protein SAMN02746093_01874 [Legionella quinlivanii DSM 21216]STY10217.1 Uncharacterised protein [Legionella quinlivanii]